MRDLEGVFPRMRLHAPGKSVLGEWVQGPRREKWFFGAGHFAAAWHAGCEK
jgi:hypothetical protein